MKAAPEPRRRRLWLGVGEAAAVAAVAIAALSYCESRREHGEESRAAAASQAARAALLIVPAPEPGGHGLALRPLDPGQSIQSQRIFLPSAIHPGPIDIAAESPSLEAAWFAGALNKRLDAARAAGAGTGWLPVGLVTTYAEAGAIRTDRSIYRLGYGWTSRFLIGRHIDLLGLALIRRGVATDPTPAVDRLWASAPHSAPGGG